MGVKDWIRRLVPFHRRNLLDEDIREQAIHDAIEICRRDRRKAGDPHNLAETDIVFDELLDAYERFGLDPSEVWWAADTAFPDNPRWLEALAARCMADKSTDRITLQILRRQSERDPDNLPVLLRLIECYKAIGDEYMQVHISARALQLAKEFRERPQRALPRGITHPLCDALIEDLSQNLARMYLSMGKQDDEALNLYVYVIERDVTRSEFLGIVSTRFIAEGRTDPKAVEVYEGALAFDPENRDLRRFLGNLYLEGDRAPEGLGILRGLLAESPPDAAAREALVAYLANHPEHWVPGDLELLIEQVKATPNAVGLVKVLTRHFLAAADLGDQARQIYRFAIDRNIEKARCLRLLARYHTDRSEWKEVAQYLEQVVRIEGAYSTDILTPLATALSNLGRTDTSAITVYEAAVTTGSRDPVLHELLCRHRYQTAPEDPASIQQFQRTLDILPECTWALLGVIHDYLRTRNYSVAFEEAFTLLRRRPADRDVRPLVAKALAYEPNPRFLAQLQELGEATAREILWLAYNEKPSAKRIAVALGRAEIRAGSRDTRLVPLLRTALHAEPDDPEIASILSECLWRAGREHEGAEVDRQILSWVSAPARGETPRGAGAPPSDDRHLAARQAAVRLSGYYARHSTATPEALEALWRAYDMGVCADEAVVFLARHIAATRSQGRRDLDILSRAVDIQPHDTILRMALLRIRASRGNVEESLRWCLEQLRQSPARRAIRDLLREVIGFCRKDDLRPEFLGQLRGLCSAHGDDRELAELGARAHQIAEVMNPQIWAVFEKALGGTTGDPALLAGLARSYADGGDYAKAAELFASLLEKNPTSDDLAYQLVRLYARMHRHPPGAATLLQRARAKHPTDFDLGLYQAELLLEGGDTPRGIKALEQAFHGHPEGVADILASADRYRHRIEETRDGLLLLARLSIQAGEPDDALHMLDTLQSVDEAPADELFPIYDQLVAHFPENVRARMERAVLYKVTGHYEQALADFETLVEEEGPTPAILAEQVEVLQMILHEQEQPGLDILRKLARLQRSVGEIKESAETYRRILVHKPDDMEAHRELARASFEMDQLDDAVEHLRKCPPQVEIALCLNDIARAYERKGQWAKAMEALRAALDMGHATAEDQARLERFEQRLRQEKDAQSAKAVVQDLPPAAKQRYELLQQISPGPDDPIYRAYDREQDEVVALKLFPEGFPKTEDHQAVFRERTGKVQALSHPRMVRILDFGCGTGRSYVVMDYLTGGDLESKLRRARGPLSIPETRRLAQELAEGLAFAHDNQLVHGNLTPGVVLYNIDGKVKITGFVPGPGSPWLGTGERGERGPGKSNPYRDPSATTGRTPLGGEDVYSYGALLYHAMTGKPPDATVSSTNEEHREGIQAALGRFGPALSSTILRCLGMDPAGPVGSFQEILKGLYSA